MPMTREQAAAALLEHGGQDGCYLLRVNARGQLVLSVCSVRGGKAPRVTHHLLAVCPDKRWSVDDAPLDCVTLPALLHKLSHEQHPSLLTKLTQRLPQVVLCL